MQSFMSTWFVRSAGIFAITIGVIGLIDSSSADPASSAALNRLSGGGSAGGWTLTYTPAVGRKSQARNLDALPKAGGDKAVSV